MEKQTNPFLMSVEELDAACTEAGVDSLLQSLAEEADQDHTLSGFRRAFAPWILTFLEDRLSQEKESAQFNQDFAVHDATSKLQ